MAPSQFTVGQSLKRVVDQYIILKYLFEVNPEHVLEFPADQVLLDTIKAAACHVPGTDPVAQSLKMFIMGAQDQTQVYKVSQLLPLVMALQGALQDKVDRQDARKGRRGGSGQQNAAQNSPSHRLQSPPSLPQYRTEPLTSLKNEPGRNGLSL
jgi:hypothetical protein